MKKNGLAINKNQIAIKLQMSAVTVSKTHKKISEYVIKYGNLLYTDMLIEQIVMKHNEEKKNIKMPLKFQLMHDKVMNKREVVVLGNLMESDGLDNYINNRIKLSNEIVEKTNCEYYKIFESNRMCLMKSNCLENYINFKLDGTNRLIDKTNEEYRKALILFN
jgi:hypothetical protein